MHKYIRNNERVNGDELETFCVRVVVAHTKCWGQLPELAEGGCQNR
jgi:hypothetical protein